jgi:hypothetical protein
MSTATTLRTAPGSETDKTEQGAAGMLPYFAEKASAERLNPGRGILWGILLAGGLWIGIVALYFLVER